MQFSIYLIGILPLIRVIALNTTTTIMNTSFSSIPTTTPKSDPGTTTTTTTTKAPLNCTQFTDCKQCKVDYHCFWCSSSKKCLEYQSSQIVPKGCKKNDWYWKQCIIPGYVLIIVVPVLGALLLLCCGCCIYCKCCRKSSRAWKKEEERITQRRKERAQKAEDKKSERKKKTDALRMKYGLLKDEDEEPLI